MACRYVSQWEPVSETWSVKRYRKGVFLLAPPLPFVSGLLAGRRAVCCVVGRLRHLFSVAEDKMVKCWDLETNQVIRHYHGHLSGVYSVAIHPVLNILFSGGRDGTVRCATLALSS